MTGIALAIANSFLSASTAKVRFAQLLAADAMPLHHMGRRFRGDDSALDAADLLLAAAVVSAAALIVWLLSKYVGRRDQTLHNDPARLFRELCRAHRLGFDQRLLLWRLAQLLKLSQPARIFLEPHRLEKQNLPQSLSAYQQAFAQLHRKLFGSESS